MYTHAPRGADEARAAARKIRKSLPMIIIYINRIINNTYDTCNKASGADEARAAARAAEREPQLRGPPALKNIIYIYTRTHTYIYIYIHVYVYIYIYVCMYVCMYIYIYIYEYQLNTR